MKYGEHNTNCHEIEWSLFLLNIVEVIPNSEWVTSMLQFLESKMCPFQGKKWGLYSLDSDTSGHAFVPHWLD